MKRYRLGWALILWLAMGLRLWGLDQHNIWWDEGLTAWAARLPVSGILDWTAHDVHPPLYFLITRGWWLLMGDGAWGLRFLPALAGVLGVALAGGLGHALGGRRAGWLSGLLLALSPFAVTWSQELRMYIWAAAAAVAALWAAYRFWHKGGRRAWIAYVLAMAAGLWTLYLTVTVLAVTNLAYLVAWWRSSRSQSSLMAWIAAQVASVALFVPWLAYALPRMINWSSSEPFDTGFFVRLYATVLATGAATDLDVWTGPTAAVIAVLLTAVFALARRRSSPSESAGLAMLLLGLSLPAVLVYALTLPGRAFYVPRLAPRYFLPLAASFYVLLGWGLAVVRERSRAVALAGVGLVAAISLVGLNALYSGRGQTDQYLSLTATLDAHLRPGDAVVLYSDADWPLFAAHFAGPWTRVPRGMTISPGSVDHLLTSVWEGADGVWLVTIPNGLQTDPERLVPTWLAQRAPAAVEWSFGETSLTLYARTPGRAAAAHDLAPGFEPPGKAVASLAGGELLNATLPLDRYLSGDALHLALTWELPPDQPAQLVLAGPATRQLTLPAGRLAVSGPTRQQVDWPLLSDLPPGRYRLSLADSAATVELVRFTLVAPRPVLPAAGSPTMRSLNMRLGSSIRLVGYDLSKSVVQPGEAVPLMLYWEATAPVASRYKVFTHLVGTTWNAGNGNFLWGQQDNEPVSDRLPTTQWAQGGLIADTYRIALDPLAPPGAYTLEVGMYGLVDGVRLPVLGADGQALGDAVVLGEITVR